jgi:hypothetical protein
LASGVGVVGRLPAGIGAGSATLALLEAIAVAVHLEDVDVVGEAVEQGPGQPLGGEHAGPLVEGQIAGDDGGAALVALAEDLEQQLGTARREGDVAQLVDDQELVAGELALQTQETLLVPGLEQLVDQAGGGGEADREAFLAGSQPKSEGDVGLAGAARSSDIPPGIRTPKAGSSTGSIRAAARRWRSPGGVGRAVSTS